MEWSIDLNAVLQAVAIASVLGGVGWVRSGISKLSDKMESMSEAQAVMNNEQMHTRKELSSHKRRIDFLEKGDTAA